MAVWLHTVLTLAPRAGSDNLRDWLVHRGEQALRETNGLLWGAWDGRPGLGFASNEAVLMTVWPDDAAAGAAVELIKTCPPVVAVAGTPLHPTARPESDAPLPAAGVWVFREFHVAAVDVERFLALSVTAWSTFEARFEARVAGLFRGPNENAELATLLLLTRYPDHAAWEASRSESDDPDAWARFRERHALTRWTRARSAHLLKLEPATGAPTA